MQLSRGAAGHLGLSSSSSRGRDRGRGSSCRRRRRPGSAGGPNSSSSSSSSRGPGTGARGGATLHNTPQALGQGTTRLHTTLRGSCRVQNRTRCILIRRCRHGRRRMGTPLTAGMHLPRHSLRQATHLTHTGLHHPTITTTTITAHVVRRRRRGRLTPGPLMLLSLLSLGNGHTPPPCHGRTPLAAAAPTTTATTTMAAWPAAPPHPRRHLRWSLLRSRHLPSSTSSGKRSTGSGRSSTMHGSRARLLGLHCKRC